MFNKSKLQNRHPIEWLFLINRRDTLFFSTHSITYMNILNSNKYETINFKFNFCYWTPFMLLFS